MDRFDFNLRIVFCFLSSFFFALSDRACIGSVIYLVCLDDSLLDAVLLSEAESDVTYEVEVTEVVESLSVGVLVSVVADDAVVVVDAVDELDVDAIVDEAVPGLILSNQEVDVTKGLLVVLLKLGIALIGFLTAGTLAAVLKRGRSLKDCDSVEPKTVDE